MKNQNYYKYSDIHTVFYKIDCIKSCISFIKELRIYI